jgi:general secretion pathway protein D
MMGYTNKGKVQETGRRAPYTKHIRKLFHIIIAALISFLLCFSLSFVSLSFAESEHSRDQKVTFNFVDVDLSAITKFISEITKKNFIFDERVKGKITIIAPSKLSVTDAYTLFVSVLELKGFTVIPSGVDAYKIIPIAEARQKGVKIGTEKTVNNDSYSARLIKLKSITADESVKLLQPVISKDGYLSAFGPGNMLLIMDSGLNIEKVLNIIESIDQPSSMDAPDMVLLKSAGAESVAKILNDGLGRRAFTMQTGSPEIAKAVADTRMNAVILFGEKGAREAMKSLISHLDVPSPESQGRINVLFLENADATELAKVLEGMLKGGQASKGGAPSPASPFEVPGGLTVTADKATNSLVIVASPSDYQNFSMIVKQLDKRRRQVYVEAMIVEVSINKTLELGAKWRGAATVNGQPIAVGGVGDFNTNDFGSIQSIITGMAGATLGGGLGSYTLPPSLGGTSIPRLAAIFSLNDFKGAVNVLSTPQLLTADNKESEIFVGSNVPFISKMEATPTTVGTTTTTSSYLPLTSVERQDVGIKLKLTPQITEGDYVKLDVYQEISSVTDTNSQIGPTTDKRSTKTSVVVKDKETVVIGGLIKDTTTESITKVPLLGDIPILGWLFKQKKIQKDKTNLLVFITPRIVKEADTLSKITTEKQKELAGNQGDSSDKSDIMLKFRDGVSEAAALALISGRNAKVTGYLKGMRIYQVRLKKGQTIESAVKEFSALPEVEFAEPSYKVK